MCVRPSIGLPSPDELATLGWKANLKPWKTCPILLCRLCAFLCCICVLVYPCWLMIFRNFCFILHHYFRGLLEEPTNRCIAWFASPLDFSISDGMVFFHVQPFLWVISNQRLRYEYLDSSGKYMLGVQGHPEKPDTDESVRQELFQRFFAHVSSCQD